MNKMSGFALAAAAAALFAVADVPLAQASDGVHCMGINGCKGQSECKTATGACKGQNGCKGQGWLSAASADDCAEKSGKVAE